MSSADALRKQGNSLFSGLENLGRSIAISRFNDVVRLYNQSLSKAIETSDNKAASSAAKNLAAAHHKALTLFGTTLSTKAVIHHTQEAWSAFGIAFKNGFQCQSPEWHHHLAERGASFIDDFCHLMTQGFKVELEDRVRHYSALAYSYNPSHETAPYVKMKLCLELADIMFKTSVTHIEDGDYKSALRLLHDSCRPIEESDQALRQCQSWLGAQNWAELCQSDINVLREDVILHMDVAHGMQSIAIAEEHFDTAINTEETVLMTYVFHALDELRNGLNRSKGKHVESQAIALSMLGHIFDKVFKRPSKAKEHYQESVQLAMTLAPRNLNGLDWYDRATDFLREAQEEARRREEEADAKWKKPYLDELKDEIEAIEALATPGKTKELLEHVYSKHKPIKDSWKLETPVEGNEKERLKKALTHYHPDRNKSKGKKWLVLCEKITQILSGRYETFK